MGVPYMNVLSGTPDQILCICLLATNSTIGVTAAVALRTKNQKLKSVSLPACISAIFGVTEPALYGVAMLNIKMLVAICIGSIPAGLVVTFAGLKQYSFTGLGIMLLLGATCAGRISLLYVILLLSPLCSSSFDNLS